MRRSYHDREADYRRRVRIITPIAATLILVLFFSSRDVPYETLERHFGWEGPTRILPDITIIPDTDPFEDTRQESRRRAMAAIDVEEWDETGPAEGAKKRAPAEAEPEEKVSPELDKEMVRHYPAHTAVPYSEDYVIIHMVKPEYPPDELDQGVEGDVTLEILVDVVGVVEAAWVLTANGPQSFESVSLDAIRQFRFKPPIVEGRPSEMWIRFQFRFRIIS
jgi:TonB family protein